MTALEFVRLGVAELHSALLGDVKGLTQQQLAWKPAPQANPIGFLFWHYIRTEDNMVHGLQGKAPLWESENWYAEMGMEPKAQGTGFKEPDVERVAGFALSELLAYAERVTRATEDYLSSIEDAQLDLLPDPARPNRTVAMIIRNFLLAHGWWHLGEIRYLRGMQGMPFAR